MAQVDIQQAFDQALQHHRAGRLREAGMLYKQILAENPRNADALHYLGVIAHQAGQHEIAVDLIRQAIAINPGDAGAFINLGNVLRDKGQLDEAMTAYRQAVSLNPKDAAGYNNLGNVLREKGELDDAVAAYRQAVVLRPDYAEAHYNLGNVLKEKGQFEEAIAAYRQAIVLRPDVADAHGNLGNTLRDNGQLDEAIAAFRQAIALNPNLAGGYNNLGNVLRDNGQLDEAVAAYRQAVALSPNYAEAHYSLGNVLKEKGLLDQAIACYQRAIVIKPDYREAHFHLGIAWNDKGQLDRAVACFQRALALRPDWPEAYNNLGNALKDNGQLDEAIAAYRKAIRLKSDLAETRFQLALTLLSQGEYEEGWKEFEWRLRTPSWMRPERNFSQPRWIGQEARDKTILLFSDARFGDAMHCIRYAPLVADLGATVLLECQRELLPLLNRVRGISAVFPEGERPAAFDLQTPLLSLPLAFGTTMKTIPANVPYLSAPPQRIEQWAKRLAGEASLKVGLVWAGSAMRDKRSCSLAAFAPLAVIPGVTFYGLQKGPEANQPVPPGLRLIQLGEELGDFADTAALVSNLDLVISVDTSVVHLAGGLGRPVWTLIPSNPGHLWLRDRLDSPWYPSMRLFRQPRSGDWDSVVTRVVDALSLWIKDKA